MQKIIQKENVLHAPWCQITYPKATINSGIIHIPVSFYQDIEQNFLIPTLGDCLWKAYCIYLSCCTIYTLGTELSSAQQTTLQQRRLYVKSVARALTFAGPE